MRKPCLLFRQSLVLDYVLIEPKSEKCGLLIERKSSIYRNVKLNYLVSLTSVCRNSDSYENKMISTRRVAHFLPIGMPTIYWKSLPLNSITKLLLINFCIWLLDLLCSMFYLFIHFNRICHMVSQSNKCIAYATIFMYKSIVYCFS